MDTPIRPWYWMKARSLARQIRQAERQLADLRAVERAIRGQMTEGELAVANEKIAADAAEDEKYARS